jgi:hypothetical protein
MANPRSGKPQYRCSFCGKSQEDVRRLIAGPGAVYICDECVELCREIIDEDDLTASKPEFKLGREIPKPKRIAELLDQYVIGQDRAKKVLLPRATSSSWAQRAAVRHCLPRPSPKSSTCRSPSPTLPPSPRPGTWVRT